MKYYQFDSFEMLMDVFKNMPSTLAYLEKTAVDNFIPCLEINLRLREYIKVEDKLREWLSENTTGRFLVHWGFKIWFENMEDATLFRLRWLTEREYDWYN
jgi:hypothetical protein